MFRRVASWLRSLVGQPVTPVASRLCEKCGRPAVVFEYCPSREGAGSERHYCEACAKRALWIPNPTRQGSLDTHADALKEVTVEVERIIFSGSASE